MLLIFTLGALLLSFAPKPFSASASALWRSPVEQPILVQDFRQPNSDWSAGHRGVDYLVVDSQTVYADHAGVVSFAGTVVNRQVVSIRHDNGMVSTFEPVCPARSKGDVVATGEQLGVACFGTGYVSHCLPKLCLHFSLRTQNGYLSPLLALGQLSPSRLKPWDGRFCNLPSGAQC